MLSHAASDEMSFDEAFAAARAEVGAGGVFEWRGSYYGTYESEEWAELPEGFKNEFANHNWASEYDNDNVEVAIGDVEAYDDDIAEIYDDAEVDVEFVADNVEDLDDVLADDDVIDVEAMENILGDDFEILADEGDGEIEVEIMDDETYEVTFDDNDDLLASDVDDDSDLLEMDDDMDLGDDLIC